MSPISFDGDDVTDITIDGEAVTEVTMDGDVVWSSAATPTVTVIDDFEDQDWAEWHGSTSLHGFDTTVAYEGNVSAYTTGDTSRSITSWPGGQTEDLPAYPSRGDVWTYYIRTDEPTTWHNNLLFFMTPGAPDQAYEVFLRGWGSPSRMDFRRWEGDGTFTRLHRSDVAYPGNTWMEVTIDTSATATNTIDVTVTDTSTGTVIGSFSVDDATYNDGGIRIGYNSESATASAWYDYIHIQ